MSESKPKRMKSRAFKASAWSFKEHFSEARNAEHFKRFVCHNLETHKSLLLHWFVDYGFEFPHLLISQNLEKFCTLSGNLYPLLVKKFYANLRKDVVCWVTEVNGVRIELDLDILEEIGGLKNSGLAVNDFVNDSWNRFNPDVTFASCLRLNKAPDGRKAEFLKLNDFLLHYLVVHILLPRSFNKAQPNDEDMWYIFALKNGIHINWADVVMNHMIRRFNDPSGALPYPLLISKIIESAGVNITNELKLNVSGKANQIDRITLIKMRNVRVDSSWQWLEDILLQREQLEMEEEMSDDEAETPQSVPPSMESTIEERLSKIEERIEHGITLLETFLRSRESTSHPPPSES